MSALDGVICGTERTGLLCGKCRENYSAFYHSQDLKCTHNSRCKRTIGWLFYIISEICPVTVLFLTVIVWDIQLTTGSIQGFILYSQLFDTLHIYADGKIYLNDETSNSLFVLKLFLNVFNLNFLIHDRLSFCLWENASSLDVLAFKYVTIAYAFSLVIITVLVLNYCKFEECLKKIRRTKKNVSSSVLHGLSGFLVICYSQCIKISFLILTPATLYSTESGSDQSVVFFDGELTFLSSRHLLYAVPAIFLAQPTQNFRYNSCFFFHNLIKI